MPDFEMMYIRLFNKMTDINNMAQEAQLEAEELYYLTSKKSKAIPFDVWKREQQNQTAKEDSIQAENKEGKENEDTT